MVGNPFPVAIEDVEGIRGHGGGLFSFLMAWTGSFSGDRNRERERERERELEETETMSLSESVSLSSSSPAPCIAAMRLRFHCISRSWKEGRGLSLGSSVVIVNISPDKMIDLVSIFHRKMFSPGPSQKPVGYFGSGCSIVRILFLEWMDLFGSGNQ